MDISTPNGSKPFGVVRNPLIKANKKQIKTVLCLIRN